MWILAGMLSRCAYSGERSTHRSSKVSPQWQCLLCRLTGLPFPSHPPELKQSSAGAGGISEFLNPSILLPLRDSLVPHTDMSAFFRESENGWSCHFNTVGMNKSWV